MRREMNRGIMEQDGHPISRPYPGSLQGPGQAPDFMTEALVGPLFVSVYDGDAPWEDPQRALKE
jgi:hypothetical protein